MARVKMVSKVVTNRHPLSQRFHDLLAEVGRLHDQKQLDYGKDADPFDNMNAAKEWAVEPWVMAMMRVDEKVRRLKTMAMKGRLANESALDSFNDIAVLALIARVLFENLGLGAYVDYVNFSDLVKTPAFDDVVSTTKSKGSYEVIGGKRKLRLGGRTTRQRGHRRAGKAARHRAVRA